MTKRERGHDGRFLPKHTEITDHSRYVTIIAKDLRAGMMLVTSRGMMLVTGRVAEVHKRFTMIDIVFDDGSLHTRRDEDAVMVDTDDLATALMLTDESIPRRRLGYTGL